MTCCFADGESEAGVGGGRAVPCRGWQFGNSPATLPRRRRRRSASEDADADAAAAELEGDCDVLITVARK